MWHALNEPVNICTDVIIICLPITMVSRLQMKLKQKVGVGAIFALGFFVVIASSTSSSDLQHGVSAKLTSLPSRARILLQEE